LENNKKYTLALLAILFLSIVLIFSNLDRSALWQDEGETVCVSKTIFESGIPKGTDGLNSFSQQQGLELGENNEWKLHPWFQFYWSALFMSVTDGSTFSLRFPFALLGFGSILLMYFVAFEIFKDKKTAIYSTLLLATNLLFLLLVRQVRYYPAVTFFLLLGLLAYFKTKDNPKLSKWDIVYLLAGIFLFSSQYFYGLALWGGVMVYSFFIEKQILKKQLIIHFILGAICLPYLLWMLDNPYAKALTESGSSNFWKNLFALLDQVNANILSLPAILIVVALIYNSITSKKERKFKENQYHKYYLLLGISAVSIFMFAFVSKEIYVRYLCGIIPLLLIVFGRLLSIFSKFHKAIPVIIIIAVTVLQGLPQYVTKELNDDYTGPITGIVSFLENESKPGDRILIPYGDLPLKYYLPDRVYTGGHTANQPKDGDEFDFIVIRKTAIMDLDYKTSLWIKDLLSEGRYELLALNVADNTFENRETPDEHIWEAPKVTAKNQLMIAVNKKYRKVK
jgi:4-amino-4-deoxy-L-arabinose transferase-like glycosyltransferase